MASQFYLQFQDFVLWIDWESHIHNNSFPQAQECWNLISYCSNIARVQSIKYDNTFIIYKLMTLTDPQYNIVSFTYYCLHDNFSLKYIPCLNAHPGSLVGWSGDQNFAWKCSLGHITPMIEFLDFLSLLHPPSMQEYCSNLQFYMGGIEAWPRTIYTHSKTMSHTIWHALFNVHFRVI